MGRKRYPPTDPREWLNRARSNLAGAGQADSSVYLEDLCFDAQQAAEKAIKAVFIYRGLRFPYVHDLKRLLQLLNQGGVKVPKYVWMVEELTPFAFESALSGTFPSSHTKAIPPCPADCRVRRRLGRTPDWKAMTKFGPAAHGEVDQNISESLLGLRAMDLGIGMLNGRVTSLATAATPL